MNRRAKPYKLRHFVGDCFATIVTSGLWLVWVVIREVQYR